MTRNVRGRVRLGGGSQSRVPCLGSVAQSGRIWSLNFLCWPMPGNGVLICLTLHPAIVIAASTSSRMPSVKDTMASGLCVAMRSARLSRAATQASRRALPRRLSIGVIERSSRYQPLALKEAMVP
jgi:hypothetical protein